MRRIVIVGGGHAGRWELGSLREDDLLVGADRGALFLLEHGYTPHLSIGDFDSVTPEERRRIREQSRQFQACDPIHKDDTDTAIAFQWALEQDPDEIVLYGALGTRFDHTLANVHLLRKALEHQTACVMADEHNMIRLMKDRLILLRNAEFPNISLLPLSMQVTGIELRGFMYPLHDATLTIGQSLGISNRISEDRARIEIASGELLVIQSRDAVSAANERFL